MRMNKKGKPPYRHTAVGGALLVIAIVLLGLITLAHLGSGWYTVAGALAGLGVGNLLWGLFHRDGGSDPRDLRGGR